MREHDENDGAAAYDRNMLLFGELRNRVLDLPDVQRYGIDSFGDEDYVSLYGMRPAAWFAAGVRILGRTAVECTRDELACAIAKDVAAVAASRPAASALLAIDPFAGSGNTLYWVQRLMPGARGLGFEVDRTTYQLASRNLAIVSSTIELENVDYAAGLEALSVGTVGLIVVFIAPPWGDALNHASGLDLRRTTPPIVDIQDRLADRFPENPLMIAVQVYENVNRESVAEVASRCDWSALHTYDLNAPGRNHGILLGTRGWSPRRATALAT